MWLEGCEQSDNNNWSCSKTISLEKEAKGIFIDPYSNQTVRIYIYTSFIILEKRMRCSQLFFFFLQCDEERLFLYFLAHMIASGRKAFDRLGQKKTRIWSPLARLIDCRGRQAHGCWSQLIAVSFRIEFFKHFSNAHLVWRLEEEMIVSKFFSVYR